MSTTRIDRGEPVPADLRGMAGLVVMGGPMGVYEAEVHPHLLAEQRLIESALRLELPVLGVCLGSQLLAATLGARVAPGPRKEIGWFPVTCTEAARTDPLFAAAPATFTALHWHGDAFDLPSDATSLARSELTPHQAFRWGKAAHGLLFHLEATLEQVDSMAQLFAEELEGAAVDAGALRVRAREAVIETQATATTVFDAWAAQIVASPAEPPR
jgi:GMP synthase (glutamine-hydrolysing)